MSKDQVLLLLDERRDLLQELGDLSALLHGSWVERYSTCSRPNCSCHHGKRHGPRYYLVINVKGRQRQRYIPVHLADAVHEGLAQYRRLQEIVQRLTEINLALLRHNHTGK
mgnify:CR=1 FL=1|jgi:hypothetical protein